MNIEELANVTASCGVGPKGQKTFHTIAQGSNGKYGTDILINLTRLEEVMKATPYTFTNQKGEKILPLRAKLWPPKTQAPEPPEEVADTTSALDDSIPF